LKYDYCTRLRSGAWAWRHRAVCPAANAEAIATVTAPAGSRRERIVEVWVASVGCPARIASPKPEFKPQFRRVLPQRQARAGFKPEA